MSDVANGPSASMLQAMLHLWQLRPPGPDNLLQHQAFVRLCAACSDVYPNATQHEMTFALSTALRSLGLPCNLLGEVAHLTLPVEHAAKTLHAALCATHAQRVHIAPLDLAEDLPPLEFGSAKVCRLKPDDLRALVDERRLRRTYQRQEFDADRLSEFHWLVVEETVALDSKPESRAVPVLFMDLLVLI